MKTKLTVLRSLILALIVMLLVFAGCQNHFEQSNSELSSNASMGKGFFTLNLGEVTLGRTILPASPDEGDFTVFKLEFLSNGTAVKPVEWSSENPSELITLDVGTYELHVTAYLDAEKAKPAAWGNKTGIVIEDGKTTAAGVELAPITNAGQGAFKWTISYPLSTTTASMKITPLTGTNGPEQTRTLTSGLTDSLALNAGYYRVVFTLRDNAAKSAERWEILHIYQNMESAFTCSFTADQFQSYNDDIPNSVRRVLFTGPTEIVTLNSLKNNEIYLVKVNVSNNIVSAADTGGPPGSTPGIASGNVMQAPDNAPKVRMGHPAADVFHANHPPFERRKTQSKDGPLGAVFPSSPTVGAATELWVESTFGSGNWVQKPATLKALGTWGNIWVMDDLTTFTDTRAQEMSDKFDLIYPIETSLLGNDFGGWNIDSKIQILVYDIGYKIGEPTTLGYFWGKDMYPNTGSYSISNEAAMFYINGNAGAYSAFGADEFYSTLVHEFQHMIHFSRKEGGSESWYNEMLSMLAEDVISPLIGIGPTNVGHPIQGRIPTFLSGYYRAGITEWGPNDISTLYSYAIDYAFGAYLLRNYGGAELLQEMMANNSTDIDSITAALITVNGNNGLSFEKALRRFGEAMVFGGTNMPADVQSFDKTVTKTIGAYTYTAAKFNIWSDFGSTKPKIFGSTEQFELRPHSLTVHQDSGWTNQWGTKTITLQRPIDPNVEFYLMVK